MADQITSTTGGKSLINVENPAKSAHDKAAWLAASQIGAPHNLVLFYTPAKDGKEATLQALSNLSIAKQGQNEWQWLNTFSMLGTRLFTQTPTAGGITVGYQNETGVSQELSSENFDAVMLYMAVEAAIHGVKYGAEVGAEALRNVAQMKDATPEIRVYKEYCEQNNLDLDEESLVAYMKSAGKSAIMMPTAFAYQVRGRVEKAADFEGPESLANHKNHVSAISGRANSLSQQLGS